MFLAAYLAVRCTFASGAQSEPIGSFTVVIALAAIDLSHLLPANLAAGSV